VTFISFDETIERALACIGCHFAYAEAWKTSQVFAHLAVNVNKMPWPISWASRYLATEAEIQVANC